MNFYPSKAPGEPNDYERIGHGFDQADQPSGKNYGQFNSQDSFETVIKIGNQVAGLCCCSGSIDRDVPAYFPFYICNPVKQNKKE